VRLYFDHEEGDTSQDEDGDDPEVQLVEPVNPVRLQQLEQKLQQKEQEVGGRKMLSPWKELLTTWCVAAKVNHFNVFDFVFWDSTPQPISPPNIARRPESLVSSNGQLLSPKHWISWIYLRWQLSNFHLAVR